MRPQRLATILVIAGTALALYVAIFKREGSSVGLWFPLVFVLGPWIVISGLFVWLKWARGVALAAGLMLALELLIYFVVFVSPQSSTDAVAYVFKPWVQLLLFLPFGLLIGRVLDKKAADQTKMN